jgi:hypothetical protein
MHILLDDVDENEKQNVLIEPEVYLGESIK